MKICEILKKKEETYINAKFDMKLIEERSVKIQELKLKLGENNNKISSDVEFMKIRSLAIEEGGFLNTENRLFFYEIILDYLQEKFNYNQYYKQDEPIDLTPCRFINEITNDYERTNVRTILSNEIGSTLEDEFSQIIEKIKIFTMKLFSNQEFNKYFDYYQGYQQLSLMILLLNIKNEISQSNFHDEIDERSLSLMKKISETHFFHFLHKKFKIPFDEILTILNDLIIEIDSEIRDFYRLSENSHPTYALTWIITWLSMKNSDLFLQFRIFDFLISSDSMAILYLCAVVQLYLFNKFR